MERNLQCSRSVESGAAFWLIQWLRFRSRLGHILHGIRMPGFVRDCETDDLVTGYRIAIRVTGFHTQISIGSREFTFDRLTGNLIGSGMAICNDAPTTKLHIRIDRG